MCTPSAFSLWEATQATVACFSVLTFGMCTGTYHWLLNMQLLAQQVVQEIHVDLVSMCSSLTAWPQIICQTKQMNKNEFGKLLSKTVLRDMEPWKRRKMSFLTSLLKCYHSSERSPEVRTSPCSLSFYQFKGHLLTLLLVPSKPCWRSNSVWMSKATYVAMLSELREAWVHLPLSH